MVNPKANQFITQIITAVMMISIVVCVLIFPLFIPSESNLVPINFVITEQEQHTNIDGNNNTAVLRGHFDKTIKENEKLWLYAENAEIALRVDGNRYFYNERGDTPSFFRSPGSGWYDFISNGLDTSNEVEFSIYSYYNDSDTAVQNMLSQLYVGDGYGLYRLMLKQIDLFTVVLIVAFFVGLLYMFEGSIDIQQRAHNEGMRIGVLGTYCFTGALWCITDSIYPYLNLLISPRWVVAFLDSLGLILFPIALAAMMRFYISGVRTRKVMGMVVLAEIVLAVICLIRQFIGQADLIEQQTLNGAVALIALIIAIICIAVDLWRYRDSYLFLLILAALPVLVAVALDGTNIFLNFMPRRTCMRYGFSISVFMLILQIVSYAKAEYAKAEKLRRMENELADSRIAVMLSQIQPHFLYNTLANIKELCDTGEQQATSNALGHFAYYLRGNMDSLTDKRLIPFTQEINHIKDYLYLEQIRFEDKLRIVWELNFTEFMLPPLTLQPIVENAVCHGITEKKYGGTLIIRSEEIGDSIIITVTDDGVGFNTAEEKHDGRTHVGINNVRKRLTTQCGGSLIIESVQGVGTTAKIVLLGNGGNIK